MFKFLYDFVEKIRPNFEKGGKLRPFWSLYDGFATFLFTPNTPSKRVGVQVHDSNDSKRTMIMVIIALIPALLFGMFNAGYQHMIATGALANGLTCALFWKALLFGAIAVMPILIVSYTVGLGIEFTVAQWKNEEIAEGFLVTGFIIPLIVPINTPLWMVAVATAFAVIFAKEVFGGTGYNIFNVALITRAFLFFAYPTHMTGDKAFVWDGKLLGFTIDKAPFVDGFSGATPLGQAATGTVPDVQFWDAFCGLIPGSVGETSVIAIGLGALLLLFTRVASWKTMTAVFAGGAITAALFNLGGSNAAAQMPWYLHLVTGGFCFGAVFMATDPVTSARTECGKWIYGLLIGMMAVVIRVLNPGYPEGMMLAILLGNALAPLIDWCIVQINVKKRAKRAIAK